MTGREKAFGKAPATAARRWAVAQLRLALAALLLVVLIPSGAMARDAADRAVASELQRYEALLRDKNIPGMSIAIARDGVLLWSAALGMADLEQQVPVTRETLFRIGSTSKPVTATLMMRLAGAGKLDLDAPISSYEAPFPDKGVPITSRQLAGNTAGVRHYVGRDFRFGEFIYWKHYETVADGLSMFSGDALLFEPGTRYHYSSYGWNLLSAVLEKAGGASFPDLLDREVFAPAGLRHTTIDHNFRLIPNRTRFYAHWGDNRDIINAPFTENSYKYASGGMLSSAEDMVRFGSALISGKLLDPAAVDQMFTSQRLPDGAPTGYGLGWFTDLSDFRNSLDLAAGEAAPTAVTEAEQRFARIIEHRGGQIGGSSILILVPDEGLVLAAMWNVHGLGDDLMLAGLETLLAFAGDSGSTK